MKKYRLKDRDLQRKLDRLIDTIARALYALNRRLNISVSAT
jgi:hypothetical protein